MISHRVQYTCDGEGCRAQLSVDASIHDLMALRLHAARRALAKRGWESARGVTGDRHYCPRCAARAPELDLDDTSEQYAEAPIGLHLRFGGGVR